MGKQTSQGHRRFAEFSENVEIRRTTDYSCQLQAQASLLGARVAHSGCYPVAYTYLEQTNINITTTSRLRLTSPFDEQLLNEMNGSRHTLGQTEIEQYGPRCHGITWYNLN